MIKNKIFILIFFILISKISTSQISATTEDGEKIVIFNNGTWEYAKKADNSVQKKKEKNYIFLNDKQLEAGETTIIHNSGNYSGPEISTSVTIAKDYNKTLIIFWQEVDFFPLELWSGTVKLYLENNNIITLLDRNIKGKNKLKGGEINSDINQIYSVYYLSEADIIKLKNSNLSRVTYHTKYDNSTQIINLNQNLSTIKNQLKTINR